MQSSATRSLQMVTPPAGGAATSALRTVRTEREGLTALAALAADLARPETAAETHRAGLSRSLLPHLKEFYRDWPLPDGEPWYRLNGRS